MSKPKGKARTVRVRIGRTTADALANLRLAEEIAFLGALPPLEDPALRYFDGLHGFIRDVEERLAKKESA